MKKTRSRNAGYRGVTLLTLLLLTLLMLALAPLPALSGHDENEGGRNGRHSPVGAWNVLFTDCGPPFYVFVNFNRGGTSLGTPAGDREAASYGAWDKVGPNEYSFAHFIFQHDEEGNHANNTKVTVFFSMEDRDTIVGVGMVERLEGLDALNPEASIFLCAGTLRGERLPAS